MRIICLLFLVLAISAGRVQAQTAGPDKSGAALPSNEAFLNRVLPAMGIDTAFYLVAGSDTCRFEKFDYDEWVKYHLKETVPISILNELAYKVHKAQAPYYWKQPMLKNAICITASGADSLLAPQPNALSKTVFSISQPQFTDDGKYAVIDINLKQCIRCISGSTLIFHRDLDDWRLIGHKNNWPGAMY
jgi:hypothetical protein